MSEPKADRLLHADFERQARQTPDRIALRCNGDSMSYRTLDARRLRVAAGLKARGIGRHGMVGLHVERSIDWVAAQLGILSAGAAVVPLPPGFPANRLRHILEFAQLDAVVDDSPSPLDPALASAVSLTELLTSGDSDLESVPSCPDDSAFVLCSSGSTGVPKLIVRSHESFYHRLEWTWRQHPFAADEAGCQKAQMTTTHSVYELFEPLLAGAPTEIIDDETARDLDRFWQRVRDCQISRLLIVPSALRASLDMPDFLPPALRVMVLMGEYVPETLARRTIAAFPAQTCLYSIYGSTEASSVLVCNLRERHRRDEELPLGEPISPDVEAIVLDQDFVPVPTGKPGRLFIAGPALFTSYLGDAGQTAAVLTTPADRDSTLYDTRDQVRRSASGELEYLGRADHTVKVRGFRVDTLEVERAILEHPDVSQAAVVCDTSEHGDAALLGFYIPAAVDRGSIFETLRATLPAYMIPSTLVGLDEFPLTTSAKVDRHRLLASMGESRDSHDNRAGLSATESEVYEIWCELLGHKHFDRDSSFFESGGTSLTVFSLVQKLREAFALDRDRLPEQLVYRAPTIRELSRAIERINDREPDGRQVLAVDTTPLLVTLRRGDDKTLPPLFLIASAGGTLGAYTRLAEALSIPRDVIGVRDPFIWGERDPTEGFRAWTERYLDAIRERQPDGPYHLCAYSSAGAFGYEIARRLRQSGNQVDLLALVDPVALHLGGKKSYGYWALRATGMRQSFQQIVRIGGWLRVPAVRAWRLIRARDIPNDLTLSATDFERLSVRSRRNRHHVRTLAALLELNSGLPYSLDERALADADDDDVLELLLQRVREVSPEVDPESIKRLAVQYSLQVGAQHAYVLNPYPGRVLLFEAASSHAGIVAANLKPYAGRLESQVLPLGPTDGGTDKLSHIFGSLDTHYRCMRDAEFVRHLASHLQRALTATAH